MTDVTYTRYLRVRELLDLQSPLAPGVHDERLFITVHQTQELWFAQVLTELTDARDLMLKNEPDRARRRLARCVAISRTLIMGLKPLHTMPPREFHAFRPHLGTASGAQSAQFAEIEALSGAAWARRGGWPSGIGSAERERLLRRQNETSLWDAFLSCLGEAGFEVSTQATRTAAFARLALHGPAELSDLADALLEHDMMWVEWRSAHTLLVERQIGTLQGTGGSSGVSHLRAGLNRRFYPELWGVGDPHEQSVSPARSAPPAPA